MKGPIIYKMFLNIFHQSRVLSKKYQTCRYWVMKNRENCTDWLKITLHLAEKYPKLNWLFPNKMVCRCSQMVLLHHIWMRIFSQNHPLAIRVFIMLLKTFYQHEVSLVYKPFTISELNFKPLVYLKTITDPNLKKEKCLETLNFHYLSTQVPSHHRYTKQIHTSPIQRNYSMYHSAKYFQLLKHFHGIFSRMICSASFHLFDCSGKYFPNRGFRDDLQDLFHDWRWCFLKMEETLS